MNNNAFPFFAGEETNSVWCRNHRISPISEIMYRKGVKLTDLGQYESSMLYFTKCTQLEPYVSRHWEERAFVNNRISRYQQSKTALKIALRIKPKNANALLCLGHVTYDNEKDFEKALEYYRRANEINPNDHTIQISIAGCYKAMYKYKESIERCKKVYDLDPGETNFQLGLIYYDLFKYDDAMECFKNGLHDAEVVPDRAAFLCKIAVIYAIKRNFSKAKDFADIGAKYNCSETMPLAYEAYSMICFKKGDYEESLKYINKLKTNTGWPRTLNFKGRILRKLKKYKESIEFLTNGLMVCSRNCVTKYEIGLNYLEMGDLEKAKKCFLFAKNRWDLCYKPCRGLGIVNFLQGNYNASLELFNEAIELHKTSAKSFFWRFKANWVNNNKYKAIKDKVSAFKLSKKKYSKKVLDFKVVPSKHEKSKTI